MKYSKAGILKKKVSPASDILQEEAKRMQEKLSELKEFMTKEKEKRDAGPRMKDGSKWRSAATSKPISGYADLVLTQKPKIAKSSKVILEESKSAKPSISLDAFLSSCGLQKYLKLFHEQGIEDIEILQELKENHLSDLGIPIGHRLKILKKLKELKEPKEPKDPAGTESTLTAPSPNPNPIPIPSTDLRPISGPQDSMNFEMFKEALENFSKSGSATKLKPKTKQIEDFPKKVRFLDSVTEEMLPKNVKGLIQEDSWTSGDAKLTETFEESSATSVPVIIKDKKSCWNCYKIYEAANVVIAFDKEFCGKGCLDHYKKSRTEICACGKSFVKDFGFIELAQWTCSEECAEKVKAQDEKLSSEDGVQDLGVDKGEEVGSESLDVESDFNYESDDNVFVDPVTGDAYVR